MPPTTAPPTPLKYFTVNFLGKITSVTATNDGRPEKRIAAPDLNGIHLLEIEAGTGASDNTKKMVTLIEIREANSPPLPENTRLVGKAYEFNPAGTVFDRQIRLTLGYNVDELPEGVTSVGAAYYTTGDGWVYLPPESSSVAELGKLTAPVNHFTVFAILATVPEPGYWQALPRDSFKLTNLKIIPSTSTFFGNIPYIIKTGKEVIVTADVTNTSGQRGKYAATLKINGTDKETKEITLEPGQTKTVSFSATINEPGSYVIQVGDLSGDLISQVRINWWLWAASVVILIALCWFIIRRINLRNHGRAR